MDCIPLSAYSSLKNLSPIRGKSNYEVWRDPLALAFISLISKSVLIGVQDHRRIFQVLYALEYINHSYIM